MFNKCVSGLTLTKDVANGVFPNINGVNFNSDCSFLATMRALMYDRVPKEESIFIERNSCSFAKYELEGASNLNCVKAFIRNCNIFDKDKRGIIHICSFDSINDENNTASFITLDDGMKQYFNGEFTNLPDVDKFLEQSGNVRARVFICESKKCSIVFIERLDFKRWHLLQSLIPRLLPWYVKEKPLNEEEIKLILTLTNRYAPDYVEKIEKFATRFDFRSQFIRNKLNGFENEFERTKLERTRIEIRSVNDNIETLHARFAEYYQKLRDLRTVEMGLIEAINRPKENGDNGDSELVEYILCNKGIDIVLVNGGLIEFVVKTVISNFDPDCIERALKNKKSFVYQHYQTHERYSDRNAEFNDDRIYRLINELFIKETMKLRVCAAYRLDFGRGLYRGLSQYYFNDDVLKEYTPNQHIQVYACLGNNAEIIRRAMVDHDYVGAISACYSSASNANFTENNTGTFFMEHIFAKDAGKIIQMPDGTNVTPIEAVKWLEEQEENKKVEVEKKHE